MKLREITVNVQQTIQIIDYSPRVYGVSLRVELDENDNADEAMKQYREYASKEVEKYFKELGSKKNSKLNFDLIPEILMQPNIPKPLHGIAPRTIEGATWWNKKRKEVYSKTDDHCVACGVHKSEAKGRKWMEAHELWDIDYDNGITTIKDIVPLCHYCHNFIHSGRLSAIVGKDKSNNEVKSILEHGFSILANNKLKCFPGTLDLAHSLGADTFDVEAYDVKSENSIKWGDWKVIYNGKEYKSKFKDYDEWEKYYKGEQ